MKSTFNLRIFNRGETDSFDAKEMVGSCWGLYHFPAAWCTVQRPAPVFDPERAVIGSFTQ
jgi:hypothetical protein